MIPFRGKTTFVQGDNFIKKQQTDIYEDNKEYHRKSFHQNALTQNLGCT